jgi:hypothetical protein
MIYFFHDVRCLRAVSGASSFSLLPISEYLLRRAFAGEEMKMMMMTTRTENKLLSIFESDFVLRFLLGKNHSYVSSFSTLYCTLFARPSSFIVEI